MVSKAIGSGRLHMGFMSISGYKHRRVCLPAHAEILISHKNKHVIRSVEDLYNSRECFELLSYEPNNENPICKQIAQVFKYQDKATSMTDVVLDNDINLKDNNNWYMTNRYNFSHVHNAETKVLLLRNFNNPRHRFVPIISSQIIPMISSQRIQTYGIYIPKKDYHDRKEDTCILLTANKKSGLMCQISDPNLMSCAIKMEKDVITYIKFDYKDEVMCDLASKKLLNKKYQLGAEILIKSDFDQILVQAFNAAIQTFKLLP